MKFKLNNTEVDLPNGFYYMLPFRHELLPSRACYWVTDNEILEMIVEDIGKYGIMIDKLAKNRIENAAKILYLVTVKGKQYYDTYDGYPLNLENAELLLKESAKFYGLI